ncbi:alpha/beta hydrolase [Erythrobacter sp. JK5]|nr:alpha/beta hydrolase [Erythrobacter sp. JK5]
MLSGDRATAFLRATLQQAGFDPSGWEEPFNVTVSADTVARVEQRLSDIASLADQKVIVLGWSLGGMYARLLAHRRPECVAMVITLGSPFSGNRRANHAWRMYERLNHHKVDAPPFPEDISAKPPVRTLAFWSPRDGIVAAECARGDIDESDRQIELPFRHFELGCSRRAISRLMDELRTELA